MPIINGKKVRSRFTSLKLDEISSVDNPAQPSARGAVIKRMENPQQAIENICKYVTIEDGAHGFQEVLHENKFSEQIWPFTDALSQSIRSIVGDKTLDANAREASIRESVEEFLSAVKEISPSLSKSLKGLLIKKEGIMPKTVEELQKDLAAAEKRADTAETKLAKMSDDYDKMADDKKEMEEELEETKKSLASASDAVIKVEGVEVRKSEVGEAQFNLTKALVEKDQNRELEARAEKRFPSLSGPASAKAVLLKAAEGIKDEETRKAAEGILDTAEKTIEMAFKRYGSADPEAEPTRKAAVAKFDEAVSEIQKRDNISKTAAMQKARREDPAAFEAYQQAAN